MDPLGKFLAGPNFEGETILLAELDRNQVPRAKFDFDVVGHYSRSGIFRLLVDDQPKPVVTKEKNRQHGKELTNLKSTHRSSMRT